MTLSKEIVPEARVCPACRRPLFVDDETFRQATERGRAAQSIFVHHGESFERLVNLMTGRWTIFLDPADPGPDDDHIDPDTIFHTVFGLGRVVLGETSASLRQVRNGDLEAPPPYDRSSVSKSSDGVNRTLETMSGVRYVYTDKMMKLGYPEGIACEQVGTIVRLGVLDQAFEDAYLQGQCSALACAIHEVTGWPIVVFFRLMDGRTEVPTGVLQLPDAYPTWLGGFQHALVLTPRGTLVDCRGEHDLNGYCERNVVFAGTPEALAEIQADLFRASIEAQRIALGAGAGFTDGFYQDEATAGTFVEPLLRRLGLWPPPEASSGSR